MKSIDPALDLGNGLTLAAFEASLADLQAKMNGYNTLLSQADEAQNIFKAAEATQRDLNDRVLAGAAAKFGRNSDQYEMIGGTKRSERKRPVRRSNGEPALVPQN